MALTGEGEGRGHAVGIKAALVVLLLVTFVLMARAGLSLALADKAPDAALRINPGSAAAAAQQESLRVQKDLRPAARAAIRRDAAAIVQRDPTNVTAITTLGLATDDERRARAIMATSNDLSRRSLLAQLWLIQDAVNRNDAGEALVHYDVALRTSPRAAAILFPVLVNATTDRGLLPDLARMLARQPSWGAQYLQQLAQSGTDLPNIAALFSALLSRGVSPGGQALVILTQRLADAHRFETAWNLYRVLRPGQPRDEVRNGDFADSPYYPVVFDWQLSDNQADLAATMDRAGSSSRLTFSAGSGTGGAAAQQMMLLEPGAHAISATAYDLHQPAAQRPSLQIVCAITGGEIARFPLPIAGSGGRRGSWRFAVPAGCPAQWLYVLVPASDSFEANTGAVSQIRVD